MGRSSALSEIGGEAFSAMSRKVCWVGVGGWIGGGGVCGFCVFLVWVWCCFRERWDKIGSILADRALRG